LRRVTKTNTDKNKQTCFGDGDDGVAGDEVDVGLERRAPTGGRVVDEDGGLERVDARYKAGDVDVEGCVEHRRFQARIQLYFELLSGVRACVVSPP
jgi:hypothetical protein